MKPHEIVKTEGTLPKQVLPTIDLYMDARIVTGKQIGRAHV